MKSTTTGLHALLLVSQVWIQMSPSRCRSLGLVGWWGGASPPIRSLKALTFAAHLQRISVIIAELAGRMRRMDQPPTAVSRKQIAKVVGIARVARSGARATKVSQLQSLCHAIHVRHMVVSMTHQGMTASAVPIAQRTRTVAQITQTSVSLRCPSSRR